MGSLHEPQRSKQLSGNMEKTFYFHFVLLANCELKKVYFLLVNRIAEDRRGVYLAEIFLEVNLTHFARENDYGVT